MELAILFIGAYHPIKYGHILLFDIETNILNAVILVLLAVTCFILSSAVLVLCKTNYLDKKTQMEIYNKEGRAVNTMEKNVVLQKITEELLQPTDAKTRNIPVNQRWDNIENEIDRQNNHFTKRLKARYPTLKEDLIHLSCLIRIGMDSFKIIQYLGISKDYLRKKRQLLAKTMEIKNSKKNLEQFIMEF